MEIYRNIQNNIEIYRQIWKNMETYGKIQETHKQISKHILKYGSTQSHGKIQEAHKQLSKHTNNLEIFGAIQKCKEHFRKIWENRETYQKNDTLQSNVTSRCLDIKNETRTPNNTHKCKYSMNIFYTCAVIYTQPSFVRGSRMFLGVYI